MTGLARKGDMGSSADRVQGALAEGSEPAAGTLLCNRYHLERPLAQGATAVVYRARDVLLDEPVAVKLVLHDGLLASPEACAMHIGLRDEALLAMHLSHPKILRVYNYERHAPWEFLVMELVAGQDLSARGGAYSVRETLHIGAECLEALAYAHAAGVVHNDIKPRNILLTRAGAVKLCDFGLARVEALARGGASRPAIGTPAYMSPEIIRGERGDARSDLYSLAATLWTLATGRTLFGSDDTALVHHLVAPVPDAPSLPRVFASVLRRALAKRATDRFQSAIAMREALLDAAVELRPDDDAAAAVDDDEIELSIEVDELTAQVLVDPAERARMVRVAPRRFRSAYGGEVATREFFIDRAPVTNAEYERYVVATGASPPPHWLGAAPRGRGDHPVVGVTLDDARSYAAWVGKRLPTSHEWEAAARGPRLTAFPWGAAFDAELAVCREAGATGTAAVSTLAEGATPEGMLHAVGNVWEWTEPRAHPPDRDSTWVMGGSFRHACGAEGRIARTAVSLGKAYEYLGFRCVLDAEGHR